MLKCIPKWGHFPQPKLIFLWILMWALRSSAAFQAVHQLYPNQPWFSLESSFIWALFHTHCLTFSCRPGLDDGAICQGFCSCKTYPCILTAAAPLLEYSETFPFKLKFITESSWLSKLLWTKWAMKTTHMNAFSLWQSWSDMTWCNLKHKTVPCICCNQTRVMHLTPWNVCMILFLC